MTARGDEPSPAKAERVLCSSSPRTPCGLLIRLCCVPGLRCDLSIHKSNKFTESHARYLFVGIKLGLEVRQVLPTWREMPAFCCEPPSFSFGGQRVSRVAERKVRKGRMPCYAWV